MEKKTDLLEKTKTTNTKEKKMEKELNSQKFMVLHHLHHKGNITSKEAFDYYGATRLSAIIYSLREDGIRIGMVWEEGINRFGKPVRYGRYFLEKETTEPVPHKEKPSAQEKMWLRIDKLKQQNKELKTQNHDQKVEIRKLKKMVKFLIKKSKGK